MTDRRIAPPQPNAETEHYWTEAAAGRLIVKTCHDCGQAHHYPRALCPHCFSPNVDWIACTGRGEIYSFSVMRRAGPPYAIAYVRLAEHVSLMTNIIDCDLDGIRIGQAVEVVFKASDGGPPVPMFRLSARSAPAG